MAAGKSKIIYTLTDEAPLLATCAFLPIIRSFTGPAGIEIEKADISVSARLLAEFSECLNDDQKVPNTLAELGKKCLLPETNIIKLPNISASVAQLKACVKELQEKGYALPDYPETVNSEEEKALKARFGKCLGSAVNPVLREGNSDRRAPGAVKNYAKKRPHSMGEWKQWSQTHVSHMEHGDFYHGEKSMTLDKPREVRMELIAKGGKTTVLKPKLSLLEGEIIDSMFMSKKALCDFYENALEDCRQSGILFSLHVKATMMKVSHPIVFGHCVKIYYKDAFEKHGKTFDELGINVNNGMVDLYDKIKNLPESKRDEIIRDLHACQEHRPRLAMVDSAKGITNFHSPNDIIVDASMPAMIRQGGKMWGADGKTYDSKCVMPESTFARIYQEMINFVKWHGNFDPRTMGTVPNVGLMAQQAEEYGSHDKTFEIVEDGIANIVDNNTGEVLLTQNVEVGDIWRMCQVKDAPIRDWVKLAVTRARQSGMPAIFWLDAYRPHENELIKKVPEVPQGARYQRSRHPDHVASPRHALLAGAGCPRPGYHLGDRQYSARLPDRPLPDHGTWHLGQDAVHRSADERRRHVRNRCRRFGPETRPAADPGKPPALGFARRVPGPGRFAGRAGHQGKQRPCQVAGQDAGCCYRQIARQQQVAIAEDR